MKMHLQKVVVALLLALSLAGVMGVSTSAMAFASTNSTASLSSHKAVPPVASVSKTQTASVTCGNYLIPELQWEYYLQAVSVSNPSVIYWFQDQPIYGQLDRVNIWRSTNGGKTIVFLGTYQPPVSGPGIYVYYLKNDPWVSLCGYSVSFPA